MFLSAGYFANKEEFTDITVNYIRKFIREEIKSLELSPTDSIKRRNAVSKRVYVFFCINITQQKDTPLSLFSRSYWIQSLS